VPRSDAGRPKGSREAKEENKKAEEQCPGKAQRVTRGDQGKALWESNAGNEKRLWTLSYPLEKREIKSLDFSGGRKDAALTPRGNLDGEN